MVRKRLAMVRGKNFHLEGVRIKKKLKEPAPISPPRNEVQWF